MVKVVEASESPFAWRVTDPRVLEALYDLTPGKALTDGFFYVDRYEACRVVEAYRVLLRRSRPDLRLRSRIDEYEAGKFRWYAQVEPRTGSTGSTG